jgi:hypothetical protein
MNLLGDRKKQNKKKRNRSWGVKTSKPFLCKKANSLELDVISEWDTFGPKALSTSSLRPTLLAPRVPEPKA